MWDFPKFSGVFSLLCFGSIWTISMFSSLVTFVEVRGTIMTKVFNKVTLPLDFTSLSASLFCFYFKDYEDQTFL